MNKNMFRHRWSMVERDFGSMLVTETAAATARMMIVERQRAIKHQIQLWNRAQSSDCQPAARLEYQSQFARSFSLFFLILSFTMFCAGHI